MFYKYNCWVFLENSESWYLKIKYIFQCCVVLCCFLLWFGCSRQLPMKGRLQLIWENVFHEGSKFEFKFSFINLAKHSSFLSPSPLTCSFKNRNKGLFSLEPVHLCSPGTSLMNVSTLFLVEKPPPLSLVHTNFLALAVFTMYRSSDWFYDFRCTSAQSTHKNGM